MRRRAAGACRISRQSMYGTRLFHAVVRAVVLSAASVLLIPALALAQASLTGTVVDASGAVLPGVTVEASSPVLIEKVRTATTDGSGQYRLVDLRPGTYRLSFAPPGFTTVIRGDGAGRGR